MSTPHPHARVAAAAVAVSLSLAGGVVGCAATTSSARTPSVAQSDEIEPVNAELPPPKPRRTPERVIFSDESATIDEGGQSDARAFANGFGDGDVAGGAASGGEPTGLVEQLAASYDEDMKALAAMQANRKPPKSGPDAATETRTPEPPVTGNSSPLTLAMVMNRNITVTFVKSVYSVTVNQVDDEGQPNTAGGTVTVTPASLAAFSTAADPARTMRSARDTWAPPVALNSAWMPSRWRMTDAV